MADALGSVPGFLDAPTVVELLKFPLSVGRVRASLLGSLERAAGVRPICGLWTFADEPDHFGIRPEDLRTPPRRPPDGGPRSSPHSSPVNPGA